MARKTVTVGSGNPMTTAAIDLPGFIKKFGVVKSQTDADLVYACQLTKSGEFFCCTQNLNHCGGLRGALCKHLLVLAVGLTQSGQLDPSLAHAWATASRKKKPALDKDTATATFVRYKGAEAFYFDWRPTETIPEDYYAL